MAGLLESTQRKWMTECVSDVHSCCGASVWAYLCEIYPDIRESLPCGRREVAKRLLEFSGLEGYVRYLMETTPAEETDSPDRGDVGLVSVPGLGLTCAIHTGVRWMIRGECSLTLVDADHVVAWRTGTCPRQ